MVGGQTNVSYVGALCSPVPLISVHYLNWFSYCITYFYELMHEMQDQGVNFEKARTICTSRVAEFACIQLVLGAAGNMFIDY